MNYEQIMKEAFRLVSSLEQLEEMNIGVVVYLGEDEWKTLHDYHLKKIGVSVKKEDATIYKRPTRFVDAKSHLGVGLEVYL